MGDAETTHLHTSTVDQSTATALNIMCMALCIYALYSVGIFIASKIQERRGGKKSENLRREANLRRERATAISRYHISQF